MDSQNSSRNSSLDPWPCTLIPSYHGRPGRVVALITGWAILGDSLAPLQMLACVVILGGVMLGQLPGSGETVAKRAVAEEAQPERRVRALCPPPEAE